MTWVDMGGVLAVANIRGGGEYGEAWHDAGRRANKQNVFDDFIAAAEYLVAQHIASPHTLAIEGRSNGGLLIGAVVNQRPDLFAAALPGVGVMDMLRFDRFTAGRYWVDDYGYPNREADFRILRRYSPYHNIRAGVHYPPILATTADTDDRVVPGHSFKYIAAMQHADPNGAPHLIRIETRAGHGSGKPTDKQIEEFSDMYAFIAHFTGMRVPAAAVGARGGDPGRGCALLALWPGGRRVRLPPRPAGAVRRLRVGRAGWGRSRRRAGPCAARAGAAAAQLAYYASRDLGVLAPRGWHCLGLEGSNGSVLIVTPEPHGAADLMEESPTAWARRPDQRELRRHLAGGSRSPT